MRARTAKKEAANGSFVTRPIENWTHGEELIESKLTMENVAAGETVGSLEILGGNDLDAFDQAWEIRGVRGERSNDSGAEFAPAEIPIPFPESIGSILNAGGEDMFAFRSEGWIENRGNGDIEIGRFGELAVLGGVKGALEVVDFGADVDAAGEGLEKTLGSIERRESRKTTESEIDFGDRAVRTKILDAVGKGRIKVRRINELEKSALGIHAGNNGVDRDFFAPREHNPDDSTVFHVNLFHFGISTNFGASLLCGFCKGMREVTKSATRKSSGADGMGIRSGAHEKDCGGTRGPRAEGRAENASRRNDSADELGFEKFRNEIRHSHGAPAEKVEDSLLAEHAHVAASLKEIPEVFGSRLVDCRRRDGHKLVEDTSEMIESVREFNVLRGILGGNTGNAPSGFGVVVPEKKCVAIGRGGEDARAGIEYFATEFFDLHVARDLCTNRAEGMGERGGLEAGMKFLGDGAAADHFATLEHEGLETALGEIESGDKSVVTAADENYALSEGHGQLAAFDAVALDREEPPFHSFKMTWLAMRPLAPMTPPPGWVAEPHI